MLHRYEHAIADRLDLGMNLAHAPNGLPGAQVRCAAPLILESRALPVREGGVRISRRLYPDRRIRRGGLHVGRLHVR